MKILILNAGSSSLKYQLMDMDGEKMLAKGLVERIGIDGSCHQANGRGRGLRASKHPFTSTPTPSSWCSTR